MRSPGLSRDWMLRPRGVPLRVGESGAGRVSGAEGEWGGEGEWEGEWGG